MRSISCAERGFARIAWSMAYRNGAPSGGASSQAMTATQVVAYDPVTATTRRRPIRSAREPRAVHAAGGRQCVRRRHGRLGAQHPAGDGGAGVSSRRPYGRPVVHRGVRGREGADQLRRRSTVGPLRAQARAGRGLAGGRSRALPSHVGTDLELGAVREPPARYQPGSHVVDDRHHEDRPRRPETARAGHGA